MCTFSSLYLHIISSLLLLLHDHCMTYYALFIYFLSILTLCLVSIIPSTLVRVFVVLSYSSSPYTMHYKAVVYYMYIDSNISVCLSVCLSPSLSPFSPSLLSLSLPSSFPFSLPLPLSFSLPLSLLPQACVCVFDCTTCCVCVHDISSKVCYFLSLQI